MFSVETASVPDLIPLPYHSTVLTNSSSDDSSTKQIVPQLPAEGTQKEYDETLAIDYPPGGHTSDFIFPCQPETVRVPF